MEFVRLRINIKAVNELVREKFRGNKSWFAETIGVDPSYVNQVLNCRKIDHSPKIIKGILKYCKDNNLDSHKYIFLA